MGLDLCTCKINFQSLEMQESKKEIFVGPQIKDLIQNDNFDST